MYLITISDDDNAFWLWTGGKYNGLCMIYGIYGSISI